MRGASSPRRTTTEAIAILDTLSAERPREPQARFMKGVALADSGKTDAAISLYLALLADFPELPEVRNNLAVLYAQKGNYAGARDELEAALLAAPDYTIAYENLGDVYARLAGVNYEKAIARDAKNKTAPPKLKLVREVLGMRAPPAARGGQRTPACGRCRCARCCRRACRNRRTRPNRLPVLFNPRSGATSMLHRLVLATRRVRLRRDDRLRRQIPQVELDTTAGVIKIELYPDAAPKTVANFIQYVKDKFYDGTQFHRVIDGFMIQGGGFTPEFSQKPTRPPVPIEAESSSKAGLLNVPGTVSMARTSDPNSATSQFFINVNDNKSLNYSPTNPGYTVFGKVVAGMDVVNKIAKSATGSGGPFPKDVPVEKVIIKSAKLIMP